MPEEKAVQSGWLRRTSIVGSLRSNHSGAFQEWLALKTNGEKCRSSKLNHRCVGEFRSQTCFLQNIITSLAWVWSCTYEIEEFDSGVLSFNLVLNKKIIVVRFRPWNKRSPVKRTT